VTADVYDAASVLEPESFDVVYSGKGALIWLPDVARWAEVAAKLLRPGGFLYLVEFHPVASTLADEGPNVSVDYFRRAPFIYDEPGSYAEPSAATTHNLGYEWLHPISSVLGAVLGAGLRLQFFHEWDYTLSEQYPWLVPDGHGHWRFPGPGNLPLMYSLKATRAGSASHA
jgi:SAM-dependent methyltransferase